MTEVFADTLYWIALINSRDQWHEHAVSIKTTVTNVALITTDSVLMEVANFFAEYGDVMRLNSRVLPFIVAFDVRLPVFCPSCVRDSRYFG